MSSKKTVVFVASTNPGRYSNMAVKKLVNYGHEVVPIGFRDGTIKGLSIQTDFPNVDAVDTVTLYINPFRQREHYDYILGLEPKRIIFNPGTENDDLVQQAQAKGIETLEACTLVLLSIGRY